ncbi:sigma-70 family RNA polymerase sigma factor [Polyangium sp. 6x1]|uniref:RNA polymerase sigma factor n=1 Tax=Polyangium sp. 6x1 TaxID=3042689 RepID=UPI0024822E21|nr:sigma-70 family RNA polymerase sigma factor [Polyangium sp. 6x1]MDI1448991.1 sigma-70 family RNA polymerase sigma factor [Polyangium sp. 6x1]
MTHERSSSDGKRRRARLVADLDHIDASRHLYHDDEASEARLRLQDAVRDAVATVLTDKQREVVEAYFFEGLSQGEIARRLGVTQQVVQKRIYGAGRDGRTVGGALRKLRDALAPLVAPSFSS